MEIAIKKINTYRNAFKINIHILFQKIMHWRLQSLIAGMNLFLVHQENLIYEMNNSFTLTTVYNILPFNSRNIFYDSKIYSAVNRKH